jgi:hypothetical protein
MSLPPATAEVFGSLEGRRLSVGSGEANLGLKAEGHLQEAVSSSLFPPITGASDDTNPGSGTEQAMTQVAYSVGETDVRIAILDWGSEPDYFTGGLTNSVEAALQVARSRGLEAQPITPSEIAAGALYSYDTLVLPDNAPPADVVGNIMAWWIGGGHIVAIDSGVTFVLYAGMLFPELADQYASSSQGIYWSYESSDAITVQASHPVTAGHTPGQQITAVASDALLRIDKLPAGAQVLAVDAGNADWAAVVFYQGVGSLTFIGPCEDSFTLAPIIGNAMALNASSMGIVAGVVADDKGDLVDDAWVGILHYYDSSQFSDEALTGGFVSVKTNDGGYFEFNCLEPGTYVIAAYLDEEHGYNMRWVDVVPGEVAHAYPVLACLSDWRVVSAGANSFDDHLVLEIPSGALPDAASVRGTILPSTAVSLPPMDDQYVVVGALDLQSTTPLAEGSSVTVQLDLPYVLHAEPEGDESGVTGETPLYELPESGELQVYRFDRAVQRWAFLGDFPVDEDLRITLETPGFSLLTIVDDSKRYRGSQRDTADIAPPLGTIDINDELLMATYLPYGVDLSLTLTHEYGHIISNASGIDVKASLFKAGVKTVTSRTRRELLSEAVKFPKAEYGSWRLVYTKFRVWDWTIEKKVGGSWQPAGHASNGLTMMPIGFKTMSPLKVGGRGWLEPQAASISLAGSWISKDFQYIELKQVGNTIQGTYDHDAGQLSGSIAEANLTFQWWEKVRDGQSYAEASEKERGKATGKVSSDGLRIENGLWGLGTATPSNLWEAHRVVPLPSMLRLPRPAYTPDSKPYTEGHTFLGNWYWGWEQAAKMVYLRRSQSLWQSIWGDVTVQRVRWKDLGLVLDVNPSRSTDMAPSTPPTVVTLTHSRSTSLSVTKAVSAGFTVDSLGIALAVESTKENSLSFNRSLSVQVSGEKEPGKGVEYRAYAVYLRRYVYLEKRVWTSFSVKRKTEWKIIDCQKVDIPIGWMILRYTTQN